MPIHTDFILSLALIEYVRKGRNRKLFYQTDSYQTICSRHSLYCISWNMSVIIHLENKFLWRSFFSICNFDINKLTNLRRIDPFINRIISCDMQHKTHWFFVIYCKYQAYHRMGVKSAVTRIVLFARKTWGCAHCWCFHYYYRLDHLLHRIVHGEHYYIILTNLIGSISLNVCVVYATLILCGFSLL